MRILDCDLNAISEAVGTVADIFVTTDVADHAAVRTAHADYVADSSYRPIIGKALRRHAAALGIAYVDAGSPPGGARWRKTAPAVSGGYEQGKPASDFRRSYDPGPQSGGDDAFAAQMRRHQSWWRATHLNVSYGTGPGPNATTSYGNMLRSVDAEAGANFLTPEIAEMARAATGQPHVEPFRLQHNLLSSQPLCFNLFGPIATDLDLATAVFRQVVPDLHAVTAIEIEHTPSPKQAFLDDGTSFDILIRYTTGRGAPGFIGVEVKLAERPAVKPEKLKPRYVELTGSGPWSAEPEQLRQPPAGQLWRDHLLVEAARSQPSYGSVGLFMLVRHPTNPTWAAAAERYRGMLADPDAFLDLPLDRLLDLIWNVAEEQSQWDWLDALSLRYLELHRSSG